MAIRQWAAVRGEKCLWPPKNYDPGYSLLVPNTLPKTMNFMLLVHQDLSYWVSQYM